jgi:hypothetical protein
VLDADVSLSIAAALLLEARVVSRRDDTADRIAVSFG